jgi:glycosyltransferase involved in cell wall biosynthesis
MNSNVLVVTRKDLFPTDHGAAVKIVRTAEALSRLGVDVVLCTDDRRHYHVFRNGEREQHDYPLWLRWWGLPRPLALLRLLLAGFPLSNAFLYFPLKDASYRRRALHLARRYAARAYLAEFPAYAEPLLAVRARLGGRLLLCEHNVEYARLQAQLARLSARGLRALRQTELALCQASDAVIVVSEPDRLQLAQDGVPAGKLVLIPHGVDLQAFQRVQPVDVRQRYGLRPEALLLVYHGTYSYPPNLQALQFLAARVLPLLEQRGLAVEVLAIGSRPPATPLHPRLHFMGSVADLAEVLPAADLAVVPLLEGGGTRMKILDYFAAGVPVISTSKGIEGIPVTDGVQALIRDGAEPLAEAIASLAADRARAKALAQAASHFVATLGWDAIATRYAELWQQPAPKEVP